MEIIAHRGASRERPENTLAACERALEIGVDAIEVDLLLSKDQQLVVRHDDLLEVAGAWRYVHELTVEELQRVDVGGGARIPRLEEVLERCYGRCPLILDLKADGIAQPLSDYLLAHRLTDHLHVASFLHDEIFAMGARCPTVQRSLTLTALPMSFLELLRRSEVRDVNLSRSYVTRELMQRLRDLDMRVRAYPVSVVREAQLFATWGVHGIFTPDPAAMQALRRG